MSTTPDKVLNFKIPAALYDEVAAASQKEDRTLAAYVRNAVRAYLDAQKAKTLTADKPVRLTAAERKQQEQEAKDAARRARAAELPEFDDYGYEVYRYGITTDWTPQNPGLGYTVRWGKFAGLSGSIPVRAPLIEYKDDEDDLEPYTPPVNERKAVRSEAEAEALLRDLDLGDA